ncbi:hypothetical protein Deima_1126 [Deinococcus maricopensis DSM 21211]|uniref:Uncharacterized protein n=1 Tax=Deinococcus maricopensis (strain DSM 21211 / LMG 22137 / NRRL B-23946 / LB-34) TaxID=709986 RepID=E8U6T9_DEIML|nr:hypothetical protein Deima_1126 [Deinococcus maricopensis DSM 21211]
MSEPLHRHAWAHTVDRFVVLVSSVAGIATALSGLVFALRRAWFAHGLPEAVGYGGSALLLL